MSKSKKTTSKQVKAKKVNGKSATAKPQAKAAAKKQGRKAEKNGKPSGLDAAARVLAQVGEPLNCVAIVKIALENGYWETNGKTPEATLNAALHRDIAKKGSDSRFVKADRGKFALA